MFNLLLTYVIELTYLWYWYIKIKNLLYKNNCHYCSILNIGKNWEKYQKNGNINVLTVFVIIQLKIVLEIILLINISLVYFWKIVIFTMEIIEHRVCF